MLLSILTGNQGEGLFLESCYASLGTRRISELMFYLLWHISLATLPFRQISTQPFCGWDQSQTLVCYVKGFIRRLA